jgi:hypothetical protein
VIADTTAIFSRVGADGGAIQHSGVVLVVDAAALVAGSVARASPADSAVQEAQLGALVKDAALKNPHYHCE